MSFEAKYRGTCPACENGIAVGDEVTFAAFDEVVHVTCPPDPTALARPVCPVHFTELPVSGVCGDCE